MNVRMVQKMTFESVVIILYIQTYKNPLTILFVLLFVNNFLKKK
jgi:hypothetical protein